MSVRWRVVDLMTGAIYDLRQQIGTQPPGGECFCAPDDGHGGGCPGSLGWRIDRVRIRVVNPSTGFTVLSTDASLDNDPFVFKCAQREATTPFRVPSGSWAISLDTFNETPGPNNTIVEDPSGITPPPVVRYVFSGAIVNLDVVEIGVNPIRHGPAPADGGTVTDAGVP